MWSAACLSCYTKLAQLLAVVAWWQNSQAYPKSAPLGEHGHGLRPALGLSVVLLDAVEDGEPVVPAQCVHLPKKLHHAGCRPVLRRDDGEEDKQLEESKKFTLVMLGIIVHRFSSGSNL